VKGLPDPIEIFELTGAGSARTRLQAAALRGLTRFVGRDAEVEHLRRVLGQAAAGRGQIVAIVGEAGVGKSRLVYEFTHSHSVHDWQILEASSVSYGKATSYLPVIALLKSYFKIGDRDDHREMRDKVVGRVLGLDRALEPLLAPLLALLDVPVEDPAWSNLDPPQRRQRMLEAVKRLVLRESQVQPLLAVFEDLHWIDSETQALLDGIVESLGSARLLLLVSYRPEYEHRWGSKTAYSQLRLDRLPAESATDLLATLLGPDPGLASLTQMLVKRGNPFFLEETVRTLVETGALAGEHGAYRLTRPVEALQVPATVQTMLAARIDRLPPEDKQLLQTASVIGKDVSYALLAATADQPEEALRRGLGHLQQAEFVYETRPFPDLAYTFKHALTHDVAYSSLLHERRRTVHAQITEALEGLAGDRIDEQTERLAHHALRGELWEKAAHYLRLAGEKALLRSANRAAVANFKQAILAAQHLREDAATVLSLRFKLSGALMALADFEAQLDNLEQAKQLAQALGDMGQLAMVYGALVQVALQSGDHKGVVKAGQHALALAPTTADPRVQVTVNGALAAANYHFGRYRRAIEFAREAIELSELRLPHERMARQISLGVFARVYFGWSLGELGSFGDAAAIIHEAVRLAEEHRSAYSQSLAAYGCGNLCLMRGDGLRETIPLLERSIVLCRDRDIRLLFPFVASSLGWILVRMGRIREGLELVEEAVQAAVSRRVMIARSFTLALAGEAYLLSGRSDEATSNAKHALDLARAQEERGFEARSLQVLGRIYLHGHPCDILEAKESYRQSMVLATELDMRPLIAHCHLGLGTLYRRTDKRDQAQEHLTTATTMYREMDMRFWLERAEAEMTQ
jgi:tetratricopeptide (TPR) repeat protein